VFVVEKSSGRPWLQITLVRAAELRNSLRNAVPKELFPRATRSHRLQFTLKRSAEVAIAVLAEFPLIRQPKPARFSARALPAHFLHFDQADKLSAAFRG
jgi:hypothetical protein